MFYQICLSRQVKQSLIISNKQGVYQLPHELPNDLKNQEKSGKSGKVLENDKLVPK